MNKQVTKEQFESNPRASRIRTLCLEIVQVIKSDQSREQKHVLVNERITALRNAGVVPNAYVGLPQKAYADPGVMAEYVAGQILKNIDREQISTINTIVNVAYRMLDAE